MAVWGIGTVEGESEKAFKVRLVAKDPGWHEEEIWLSKKYTIIEPIKESDLNIIRIGGRLYGILRQRKWASEHFVVKSIEELETLV